MSDDILTHHRPRSVRAVTFVPHSGHHPLTLGTRRKQAPHGSRVALTMTLAKPAAMNANNGNDPSNSGQLISGIERPFVLLRWNARRCIRRAQLAASVPDDRTTVTALVFAMNIDELLDLPTE